MWAEYPISDLASKDDRWQKTKDTNGVASVVSLQWEFLQNVG